MKYLRINNLLNIFGHCDYKGLDIDRFISGSQQYPSDLSYCLVATDETDFTEHQDVIELTEAEYVTQKSIIDEERKSKQVTTEQKIQQLESENAELKTLLADLTEVVLMGV